MSQENDAGLPTGTAPDQPELLPARGPERIVTLDFIRGIAVMGILWANIVAFGQPMTAYMYPDAFRVPHGPLSDALWLVQFVLIDGKMRGLFTLLFGAGLMLFVEKAWARGAGRWLQLRRLAWLLAFGAVHYYLIWRGDILMSYAVMGMLALPFLRLAAKTQLILGLLGYIGGALVLMAMMGPLPFVAEGDLGNSAAFAEMREDLAGQKAEDLADAQEETRIIQTGDYADYIGHSLTEHGSDPLFFIFLALLETLPLILIGAALYRFGLFEGRLDAAKTRKWGWAGVIAGSLLTLPIGLWALSNGLPYWGTLASLVGFGNLPRLPVTLGLLALLALYGPRGTGWLGERIAAAGRAAFSNYIGTSIFMVLVFHGWAGGLFGELTRPGLYVVMLAAWAVMLAWSKPWLEHYRFGPLEWLWRCLTYGKLVPLRR